MKQYRDFANKAEKTGNLETFYYAANGNYLCIKLQVLAENEGHFILEGQVLNITLDENVNDAERLDTKLRGLNLLFDVVLLMTPCNNTVVPLVGGFQYIEHGDEVAGDLQQTVDKIIREKIFPRDQARYQQFVDFDTLHGRLKQSEKGFLVELFRLLQPDGKYEWKEISIMTIPGTEGREHLFCIKSHPVGKDTGLKEEMSVTKEYAMIWQNMIWNSKIKFFWKDKARRFRGVSQSFLDFYGFESVDELIGKNDEEMHWHVDNDPYKNDELAVIREGKKVFHVPGQCIVKGVVHNIMCSKMPLYENDEIVGLVGYFSDCDEKTDETAEEKNSSKLDRVTGLMSARSFLEAMIDYAEQYNEKGRDYALILLQNSRHDRIQETYGQTFADKVLKEIADQIIQITGQSCAMARMKESVFAILTYIREAKEAQELTGQIREKLQGITEVDGNSITLRMKYAVKVRSDDEMTDENIYERALREIIG